MADQPTPPLFQQLLDAAEKRLPPQLLGPFQAYRRQLTPTLADLEQRYLRSDMTARVAQATGMHPTAVLLAGGALAVLLFVAAFRRASALVASVVGFAYPAYQTVKALESPEDHEQHQHWLKYWSVYSAAAALEYFAGWLLHFVPFYSVSKMALLVWAYHPSTKGADQIHATVIRPLFVRYHDQIDRRLNATRIAALQLMQSVMHSASPGNSQRALPPPANDADAPR